MLDKFPVIKRIIQEADLFNSAFMTSKTIECASKLPKPVESLTEREANRFQWSLYDLFKKRGWI